MKKFYLIIFFSVLLISITSFTKAWETNLKTGCINENLDPCSTTEIPSSESIENTETDFVKVVDDENKIVIKKKEKKIVKKKKKIAKKKKEKKREKLVKKKKENIFKRFLSIKSDKNIDFDKNNSFEDFKTTLLEYNENTDYPNIDN